jgi:hypothetical protein
VKLSAITLESANGQKAVVRATEQSKRYYRTVLHNFDASRDWEGVRDQHSFEFVWNGSEWRLTFDRRDSFHDGGPRIDARDDGRRTVSRMSSLKDSAQPRLARPLGAGYYDWSAAASYAATWALSRNPAYRNFSPDDCTNFISQVLYAGGWQYVNNFYYDWWYNPDTQSLSWINVGELSTSSELAGARTSSSTSKICGSAMYFRQTGALTVVGITRWLCRTRTAVARAVFI